MEKIKSLSEQFKSDINANPISDQWFCADPTAVEFEGRLYVYGTNDHQQYEKTEKNTYEVIKSFQVFSTDDMVNWRYEGIVDVESIAPWVYAAWAPSICKRVEEDGLTHFYLYFSNSGYGVGVLTATNPLGPWTSPLDRSIVDQKTPGLEGVPAPFDPGVCIDDKGTGWLTFGGGTNGSDAMPGTMRIVRLGKDMVSLDSEIVPIKAPYSFEASELNFINGTYVYTFNSNWVERSEWTLEAPKSTSCSMCYMTTKTPLDTDSWVYEDDYFSNPGLFGMEYSNNHTHYEKFNGKWYLFYHAMILQKSFGSEGGFRSLCVNELEVDEKKVKINRCTGNYKGVSAIKNHDVREITPFSEIFNSREISFERNEESGLMAVSGDVDGAWLQLKNGDFGSGCTKLSAIVKGKGKITFRKDSLEGKIIGVIQGKGETFEKVETVLEEEIKGIHNLLIVFEGNILGDSYSFQ
ncbi:MAG: glycoside hydrolase family 43 protein [Treponema sp.]|nr:glycoside hydrolase family 43 protein [Treponema sp.]